MGIRPFLKGRPEKAEKEAFEGLFAMNPSRFLKG